MGHTDEPKMDELKRLLRRLDGLDGSRGLTKPAEEAEGEPRGYVGALRGAPAPGEDGEPMSVSPPPKEKKASAVAITLAAVAAALISTVTVYLVMSAQKDGASRDAVAPAAQPVVPSKLDYKPSEPGSVQRQSMDTADLVRRAEQLLQSGDIEGARTLLKQAAELGSGAAALKLGHSYDPKQAEALRYADSQTNPALARAWYERALALGTQEAAGYIGDPGAR